MRFRITIPKRTVHTWDGTDLLFLMVFPNAELVYSQSPRGFKRSCAATAKASQWNNTYDEDEARDGFRPALAFAIRQYGNNVGRTQTM